MTTLAEGHFRIGDRVYYVTSHNLKRRKGPVTTEWVKRIGREVSRFRDGKWQERMRDRGGYWVSSLLAKHYEALPQFTPESELS